MLFHGGRGYDRQRTHFLDGSMRAPRSVAQVAREARESESEKGLGTGIDFATACRDAGVDCRGQIELDHIS